MTRWADNLDWHSTGHGGLEFPFKLIKWDKRGFRVPPTLLWPTLGTNLLSPVCHRGPRLIFSKQVVIEEVFFGLLPAAITCRVPVLKGLINKNRKFLIFFCSFVNTRTDSVCFGINSTISVIFVQASGFRMFIAGGSHDLLSLRFVPLWIPIMTRC